MWSLYLESTTPNRISTKLHNRLKTILTDFQKQWSNVNVYPNGYSICSLVHTHTYCCHYQLGHVPSLSPEYASFRFLQYPRYLPAHVGNFIHLNFFQNDLYLWLHIHLRSLFSTKLTAARSFSCRIWFQASCGLTWARCAQPNLSSNSFIPWHLYNTAVYLCLFNPPNDGLNIENPSQYICDYG